LALAMPPEPARRRWQSRKIDPFVNAFDAMLRSDLTAPKKQRHTAVRVLDRLVEEHQATGLSYSTLRAYVAERRREIWAQAGRAVAEVSCRRPISRLRRVRSTLRSALLVLGAGCGDPCTSRPAGAGTVGVVMVSLLALVVHRLDCNEMGAVTKCAWFGRRNMPALRAGRMGGRSAWA
jgi:hypothetical protein